jgi:putative phage-type endonuclease
MRLVPAIDHAGADEGPRFVQVRCEQRSPAWYQARLGRLTGSRAADALAVSRKKGGGELAGRRNLRFQLALERMTGQSQESDYCSPAMLQGIEREDDARRAYEMQTGALVERSGFLAHPTLMAGVSLDGHVGDYAGVLELKCPQVMTHMANVMSGQVPAEYALQIRHALWLTGAAYCDFVSYNPEFPERLRLRVVRVLAVRQELLAYEVMVRAFLAEVDREVADLQRLAECDA